MKKLMVGLLCCLSLGAMQVFGENLVITSNQFKWGKGGNRGVGDGTNMTATAVVEIPEGHEKSRWMFEAERVGANYMISVNGKKQGEAAGPIIRIALSNFVAGTNTIEFVNSKDCKGFTYVNTKTNLYRDEFLKNAPWQHMGFNGGFRLKEIATPADLRLAYLETSYRKKEVTLKAKVLADKDVNAKLVCSIREWRKDPKQQEAQKEVLSFSKDVSIKRGNQLLAISSPWANAKLWDVNQPNLYVADVSLVAGGKTIATYDRFRFGFREVWTEGRNVMLNGHPLRMRFEMHWMPLNPKNVGFHKYMGFNAHYMQPHGNIWYGPWGPTAPMYETEFDTCDENGILMTCPAPKALIGTAYYQDKAMVASYKNNLEDFFDCYRNRPSLIAWGLSMNAYNPRHSIAPTDIGRHEKELSPHHEWHYKQYSITQANAICQEVDPTRLSYGHADGNLGSFGSGNCYLNNTPLQEIMEYPETWAKDGDMPYVACESGIFDGSLAKDNVLFVTEYAAIYFGDRAYDKETEMQLMKTCEIGFRTGYYGWNLVEEMPPTGDLYYDLTRLYVKAQDRYWRSYGIFGWQHFFYARYGQERLPKGWNDTGICEPDERPDWASKMTDIHRENKQTLLCYVGGENSYADQTHSFFEGETMKKNFVAVWDGANPTPVWFQWKITNKDTGETVAQGTYGNPKVMPGTTAQTGFQFRMPVTGKRTRYDMRLKSWTNVDGGYHQIDHFFFESFPREREIIRPRGKVYLYDPKGLSAWVHTLATNVVAFTNNQQLARGDWLIIGREGLSINNPLPFSINQIDTNDTKVLILEQQPTVWEAFGFKMCDMVPRYVFPTPSTDWRGFMNKMGDEDLINWRGTPTLLPEYKFARQVTQPIKGVNRHGVASTVFQITEVPGIEPLFQCEFNQQFTPMVRVRGQNGRGMLLMSSFDFTDRVGVDPAATQLAENVLRQFLLCGNSWPKKKVVTNVEGTNTLWKSQILVNNGKVHPKTDEFLAAGGTVLNIDLEDAELTKRDIKFEKRTLYRAKVDRRLNGLGVTRNLLRWRDKMEVNCITDPAPERGCEGVFAVSKKNRNEHFLQLTSKQLIEFKEPAKFWSRDLSASYSVATLEILKSRILTGLGAEVPEIVRKRLDTIAVSEPYQTLKTWYAYGPFVYTNPAPVAAFKDVLPGEDQAIKGDMNPNFTYKADDKWKQANVAMMDEETRKKDYDFRTMIDCDEEGNINLTEKFKLNGKPSYCYLMHVWEEENDGEAIFNFRFPTKAVVYANGQEVFSARDMHYGEKAVAIPLNMFSAKVKVRKGSNSIMVKLATLPKEWENGTQFFAVTRTNADAKKSNTMSDELKNVKYYNKKGTLDNVYLYRFW